MNYQSKARFTTFFAASVIVCLGQTTNRPGAGAGTTTPTTPGVSRPSTTTNPNTIPGTQNPSDMPRPIFLTGKVILSDGNPPEEAVLIERVCGTRTIPEGYTNRKGHFSIELGRNQSAMMDASTDNTDPNYGNRPMGSAGSGSRNSTNPYGANGVTERSLTGCDLRASLAGFRSGTVSLSSRRAMDNPDIGTLVLKRIGNVEGLTISATSMNAPKDARKAFEKGHEALQKGKFEDAAKQLDKAVEIYPQYAMAWFDRGRVYEAKNSIDDAKKSYEEAIKADNKLIQPYDRMAALAVQNREWQTAADISERMIRLNSFDFPQAYLFNAIANLNLEKLDHAQKSATELIKNDTDHRFPTIEHVMAVILAKKQDWEGSAKHFHAFLDISQPGPAAELARKQLGEVEKTLAASKQ